MAALTTTGQSHRSTTNSRTATETAGATSEGAWTAKVVIYTTEEVLFHSFPSPSPQ